MLINVKTGLLACAVYEPSPHYDQRPNNTAIDMVVIHNISLPPREFGGEHIKDFFCGKLDFSIHPYFESIAKLRVASHLLIDRRGVITQFVPFIHRAWHAGKSFFKGREQCNDFSIGIELEGCDDLPFEKIQYSQLARVLNSIMQSYPNVSKENIVGHSDIAPGRKTDPGPLFDWSFLNIEMATNEK